MTLIWSAHVTPPGSPKLIVKTENKAVSELYSGETRDPEYSCLPPRLARKLLPLNLPHNHSQNCQLLSTLAISKEAITYHLNQRDNHYKKWAFSVEHARKTFITVNKTISVIEAQGAFDPGYEERMSFATFLSSRNSTVQCFHRFSAWNVFMDWVILVESVCYWSRVRKCNKR